MPSGICSKCCRNYSSIGSSATLTLVARTLIAGTVTNSASASFSVTVDNTGPTVSASVTNGGISVGSLDNFDVSEKSRRHLEGKLNGGGTAIDLSTTNGGIRLRSRDTVADTKPTT